jgi:rhamnose utilization protein RhaD (predicted bifunctional aldolase and dehydrogenase)
VLPYVMPGFDLAKCAEVSQTGHTHHRHGADESDIFSFGASAKQSYAG